MEDDYLVPLTGGLARIGDSNEDPYVQGGVGPDGGLWGDQGRAPSAHQKVIHRGRVWAPPVLVNEWDAPEQRHFPVDWTEAFTDLAFVVFASRLSEVVVEDLSWSTLRQVFAQHWLFNQAWQELTFYTSRVGIDDLGHRILNAMYLMCFLHMAAYTQPSDDFAHARKGFAGGRGMAALLIAGAYSVAGYFSPAARKAAVVIIGTNVITALLMLASVMVPPHLTIPMWVMSVVVNLAVLIMPLPTARRLPFPTSHVAERFGLVVIICLGEALLDNVLYTLGLGTSSTPRYLHTFASMAILSM